VNASLVDTSFASRALNSIQVLLRFPHSAVKTKLLAHKPQTERGTAQASMRTILLLSN